MNLVNITPRHNPQHHVRRIPRGNSSKADPISRLERRATAHHQRIRSMKQRTQPGEQRKALEAARRRLVEVILTIGQCPEALPNGTHQIIDEVMAEARSIYAVAPKLKAREIRKKRPAEEKPVRLKNQPRPPEDDEDTN